MAWKKIITEDEIDDTPVNGVVDEAISSNWAYDHENAADPHTVYPLDSEVLKKDGTVALAGNMLVDALITLDGRDLSVDGTKLDGVEALADVTDATNVAAAGAVMDGDFAAADEVMVGTGAGTHGQVTLAASQFLAKKAAGAAVNVTAAEARTILNVADGADVTGSNAPQAHASTHDSGGSDQVHSIADDDDDTKIQVEEAADEDKIRMDVAGVEAFLLSDVGRLTLAKQSYFTARRTTVQSIPQTTMTKIQYNTEDVDIQGEYDHVTNFRFTAVEAGIYIVFISAGLSAPADGTRVILDAYKNGAACLRLCDVAVGSAAAFPPGGTSGIIHLVATDYIEAFIYQTGAAINIAADASANRFSMAKIA